MDLCDSQISLRVQQTYKHGPVLEILADLKIILAEIEYTESWIKPIWSSQFRSALDWMLNAFSIWWKQEPGKNGLVWTNNHHPQCWWPAGWTWAVNFTQICCSTLQYFLTDSQCLYQITGCFRGNYLAALSPDNGAAWTNERPVSLSHDHSQPMRGQHGPPWRPGAETQNKIKRRW